MRRKAVIASLLFALAACRPRPVAVEGTWRAVLTSPGGELPFTLRITRTGNALGAVIVNGAEQAPTSGVEVKDDAIKIRFDHYDSAIDATLSNDGNSMTGAWTRRVPAGMAHMAFRATRGEQPRFLPASSAKSTLGDVNGIWKAEFVDSDGVSPARGEFHQDPGSNRVTGTFLTPTGDDRYLDGSFENGLLRLSTFDGAHAFLFQARTAAGGTLAGDYWSRDSYHATWSATRSDDAGAALPDGWKDVGLTNSAGRFQFRFPDLAGNPVALTDERFRGKVVLVNIFGSWCPNCNDEAPVLAAFDRKYRQRGLEIVGLAYEFTGNAARDREMVRRFAGHYGITYPLLLAGVSDKKKASATLPDLTRVLAYPTSLFIGRDGRVKKIYSGFAGPGTGKHFDQLRAEMESLIEGMLAEGEELKRIEEFEAGQHASVTKTFTEADLQRFIEITGDVNPLHVDDDFAAATPFGRRILHGMLTASIFSTMVGMLLPGTGAIYRSQTLRFLLPVYAGETVTAHFVVRSVDRARHRLEIEAWIENEDGKRVIEGTCEAGLLRANG